MGLLSAVVLGLHISIPCKAMVWLPLPGPACHSTSPQMPIHAQTTPESVCPWTLLWASLSGATRPILSKLVLAKEPSLVLAPGRDMRFQHAVFQASWMG